MTLVSKLKDLAQRKNITFAELERKLDFSNGQIRRWDDTTPGIDKIQKVADYFNVSVDYLLGRTDWKKFDEQLGEEKLAQVRQQVEDIEQLTQFFRVDVSDLSDIEKAEFEEEMEAMTSFIAERIRQRRMKGGK